MSQRSNLDSPDFTAQTYWDERFKSEQSYDWLVKYHVIKENIEQHVKKEDRILVLGCGTSKMSEEMYSGGYTNIVNVDFSPVCIARMRERHRHCPGMKWVVMNINHLEFPDESFDVVLDKATLDALVSGEKDPWRMSDECVKTMGRVLSQISRVLKQSGRFISITFSQPHFRRPLLAMTRYDWSVDLTVVEGFLPFFFFFMYKGRSLTKDDVELERKKLKMVRDESHDIDVNQTAFVDDENPLSGFDFWEEGKS